MATTEDTKCGQLIQSVSHCDKESWTALKDLNITHLELPYLNVTHLQLPYLNITHVQLPYLNITHLQLPYLNITHLELPYLNITYDIADNMSCHTAYTDVRWQ